MPRVIKWERLAAIRTALLMLLGLSAITAGAFLIYTPAGWIILGLALMFLAFVTDSDEQEGQVRR